MDLTPGNHLTTTSFQRVKFETTLSMASSNLSALTLASDATVVSQYTPDEYERTSYYNGVTGDNDHPELIYRSDFLTTLFPKPIGRYACQGHSSTLNIPTPAMRPYALSVSQPGPLTIVSRIALLSQLERWGTGANPKDNTHLTPQRG